MALRLVREELTLVYGMRLFQGRPAGEATHAQVTITGPDGQPADMPLHTITGSREAPDQPGLGYFEGWCERFPEGSEKVPHVGWDHIVTRSSSPTRLFAGVEQNEFVYYTHSYFVPTTTVSGPCSGWPLTVENPAAFSIDVRSASV